MNRIPASKTALGAFCPGEKAIWKRAGRRVFSQELQHRNSLLLGAVNPGHSDVLQDDHDGERQRG